MNRKHLTRTAFATILSMVLIGLAACSGDPIPDKPEQDTTYDESFSFLDIGVNTRYRGNLKDRLEKILGDDAVQRSNAIDLEINRPGFLAEFFPELASLNRQLNSPVRERVEHRTVKLMYRYAREKNLDFTYVEFLFSEFSLAPLLIKVHFLVDTAGIGETLKQKYGPPDHIHWDPRQKNAEALYWRLNGDIMLLSTVPDQFGDPTYEVTIYFTARIQELVAKEAAMKKAKESRAATEKKAF